MTSDSKPRKKINTSIYSQVQKEILHTKSFYVQIQTYKFVLTLDITQYDSDRS